MANSNAGPAACKEAERTLKIKRCVLDGGHVTLFVANFGECFHGVGVVAGEGNRGEPVAVEVWLFGYGGRLCS